MKEKLIKTTSSIVEKHGSDAVSMRDVAKKVGCSPMAAYRHFSCKDELLLEVAASGFDLLTEQGNKAAKSIRDPEKRMRAVLLSYFNFGQKHKHLYDLMFGPIKKKEKLSARFQTAAKGSFKQFADYVRDFIGQTRIAEEKFEYQHAATLWADIHGITTLMSSGYLVAEDSGPKGKNSRALALVEPTLNALKELV